MKLEPPDRLRKALAKFKALPFRRYEELCLARERLQLAEVDPAASPEDGSAIQALPIQELIDRDRKIVEVRVSLFEGNHEYKTYVYFGQDGSIEADGKVEKNQVDWDIGPSGRDSP